MDAANTYAATHLVRDWNRIGFHLRNHAMPLASGSIAERVRGHGPDNAVELTVTGQMVGTIIRQFVAASDIRPITRTHLWGNSGPEGTDPAIVTPDAQPVADVVDAWLRARQRNRPA